MIRMVVLSIFALDDVSGGRQRAQQMQVFMRLTEHLLALATYGS
jgi:hypothetical protein